jgi:hypothetical protein
MTRSPWRWFTEGGWYLFVVVLTLGIGSPIPFAHAAVRLKRPLATLWPFVYAAVVVTLMAFVPRGEDGNNSALGGLIIGLIVVAFCHLLWVKRQVWPSAGDATPADPAMAAALGAREKRAEARRIVAEDPALARDLRIGRPDLSPEFDDGGLVDLGHAPADVIARVCAIDLAVAEQIVRTREARPFDTLDDAFTWADIPYALWERIRDRAVVVR